MGGDATLQLFCPPTGKEDVMSSAYENCIITSQDLKMLQSVLEGLGYDSHTMDDEVISTTMPPAR